MPTPDNLAGLEGAFNEAPSLDTAQAWHVAAAHAYVNEEITLAEYQKIGQAVRTWQRVHVNSKGKSDAA